MIFWLLIIGRGNVNDVSRSPIKEMMYGTMATRYTETYMLNTDENGRGTTNRTNKVWGTDPANKFTMNIEIQI